MIFMNKGQLFDKICPAIAIEKVISCKMIQNLNIFIFWHLFVKYIMFPYVSSNNQIIYEYENKIVMFRK